jgi:ferredoxin
LRKKGLIVIGWNDWYGGVWTLPNHFTPTPTDGHPDAIDLRDAEQWGREMVWRSQRIYAGDASLIPTGPEPFTWPDFGYDDSLLKALQFSKIVEYQKDKCVYPKCRLCMDNCPVDGIDLTVNPPIIATPCMNCSFCEQVCPTGALHLDENDLEQLFRFHRDAIRDVCTKYLEQSEAEGHFRRLIPREKITWETPIYKVYNKHPRFIIGKGPNPGNNSALAKAAAVGGTIVRAGPAPPLQSKRTR